MTLDYLLSFKHKIDGKYILYGRRRRTTTNIFVWFCHNLPMIDKRYCPYCGSAMVEKDAVQVGSWYYSSYECGVEVALHNHAADNMCSIVAISFPVICGGISQDDII